MTKKFDGQTVVVLGGSSGIGFATASGFAAAGANVIITGRNAEKLETARAKLGGNAKSTVADVSDLDAVKSFFAELGEIDHLVSCVGTDVVHGKILDVGVEGLIQNFQGKSVAQLSAMIIGGPCVKEGGSISITTGAAGRKKLPFHAPLGLANLAIESIMPVLALELAPRRLNLVAPGLTKTNVYDNLPEVNREEMYVEAAKSLPVNRVAEAEDVADAILFLAGNPHMNGTVLEIDGGSGLLNSNG